MRVRAALAVGLAATLLLLPAALRAAPQWAQVVGARRVFIRSGPGTDNVPLGVLREGHRLQVLDSRGPWWEVVTEDGIRGFVNEEFLTPTRSRSEAQEAAQAPEQAEDADAEEAARRALAKEIAALSRQVRSLRRESQRLSDLVASSARRPNPGERPTPLERVLGLPRPIARAVPVVAALLCGWILGVLSQRRRGRRDRHRLRL